MLQHCYRILKHVLRLSVEDNSPCLDNLAENPGRVKYVERGTVALEF